MLSKEVLQREEVGHYPTYPYPPFPILLDVSSLRLTNRQLEKISSDNEPLQLELTAKGELIVMPPVSSVTSRRGARLLLRLGNWAERDGTGMVFDSSGGFTLPNGAIRSPDASWVLGERWDGLDDSELTTFAHICPDFVLELRSPSDTLASLQRKMEEYLDNGCRLGWLIDPVQKRVHVYHPGSPPEILDDPETVPGDPVLPGLQLNVREIW